MQLLLHLVQYFVAYCQVGEFEDSQTLSRPIVFLSRKPCSPEICFRKPLESTLTHPLDAYRQAIQQHDLLYPVIPGFVMKMYSTGTRVPLKSLYKPWNMPWLFKRTSKSVRILTLWLKIGVDEISRMVTSWGPVVGLWWSEYRTLKNHYARMTSFVQLIYLIIRHAGHP